MKKFYISILMISVFIGLISTAMAQKASFTSYYELRDFYSASPGAYKTGLYGFTNPAILAYNHAPLDVMLKWSDQVGEIGDFNRWGIFAGLDKSGFGSIFLKQGDKQIQDYRFSSAFGTRNFSLGYMIGFPDGDGRDLGRTWIYGLGALIRPNPYLSVGAHWTKSWELRDAEYVGEIAVRPIKNYPLTFFADASIFNDDNIDKARWSSGVSWEFIDGLRINGRYFEDNGFQVGVDVSFGTLGLAAQTNHIDDLPANSGNLNGDYQSYTIRLFGLDRTVMDFFSKRDYVVLDLAGTMKYQRFRLFDNSNTLLSTLRAIDEAIEEEDVKGIIVNTNNMQANMSTLWEIRAKLQEAKDKGKKIIIFLDRAEIDKYHFASVADEIVMDRLGSISLNGYVMGRSYYADLLDKIDVGFEEIRLFKYKSAVENFSRDNMSEGDREQRQALMDDFYEISKNNITNSRSLTSENYEAMINDHIMFGFDEAKILGLADREGRWNDYKEIMKEIDPELDDIYPISSLSMYEEPYDDKWSDEADKIAIIYIVGVCDMNSGINARSLVKDVERAMKDESVKAVVLRVDSPGGDAMASDYIAKVVRKHKNKKPVIVSQGMVAASGGYWLSMDADEIMATPMTLTGSIGVISGFLYDKGLKDSMGINLEIVKRGEHADMLYPYTLPIIPIGLPANNISTQERQLMEKNILSLYGEFIGYVAQGRNMDTAAVKDVAQGRIWTGLDGKAVNLVDKIGNLTDAIELAREKAGIRKDKELDLIELPEPPLFDFGSLFSSSLGFSIKESIDSYNALQLRLDNNARPMPILPIDYSDFEPMKLR